MRLFNVFHWFNRPPALPAATVAMEQLQRSNALWGANPDRLAAAVTAYNAGSIAQLARIIDEYEQRDDTARSCVRKRDAAVARCEHTVLIEEGHEDDPRAQLHRDVLRRFWASIRCTSAFNRAQRGGIRLLKKQMMAALSTGYSCHNIIWDTSDPANLSAEFIQIPAWHFENLTGRLRFRRTVNMYYGEDMADGAWLVHAADPVGPAVALAACAKRMSLQDWLLFSERAAIPGLLAKTDAAYGTDAWNRLVEMLRAWGRDWRGIVDRNTDLTPVSLNGNGTPPMPALVDRMDRAIAALYRGADLSTISKGEGLGASLQGEEADMLEADDCAALAESLHEQVDRYVIRWATGDAVPLAYIWIEPTAKPDIQKEIAIDAHLAGMGARLSLRDALQRYGRAETDPKDPSDRPMTPPAGALDGQTPLQNAVNPLQNARRLPNERGEGDERGREEEAFLRAWAKDATPAAEAVRRLLDDLTPANAAAFAANIESLLPGEDSAMAAVLADAAARAAAEAWDQAKALHDDVEASAGAAELANGTDANGAEHAPAGSANGGQFVGKGGGSSGSPSGTTEAKKIEVGSINTDSPEEQERQLANAATAFEKCLNEQIDVPNAFHRSDIGDIDLRWGKTNKGLKHMIERRDAFAASHPGALDGRAVLSRMPETIIKGTVTEVTQSGGHPHIVIERDGFRTIITRDREGGNHWFISGYEISEAGRGYRAKK